MGSIGGETPYTPPPEPPPLLTFEQVKHLAVHGWLPITLSEHDNQNLADLFTSAGAFFSLPTANKETLHPPSHGTENGYYLIPSQKEYLTIRHASPSTSTLTQPASTLWSSTAALLHRILADISRAGGYSPQIWHSLIASALSLPPDSSTLSTSPTLLRLFNYFPDSGNAASHVDTGLLTLCAGTGPGLQVRDQISGDWADVGVEKPVVLVGSFLRALLLGRVTAGVHRVVGTGEGRRSVVFALRPDLSGTVDLENFGGKGVVEVAGFWKRVRGLRWSVNVIEEEREAQQAKQRAWKEESRNFGRQDSKSPVVDV